MKRWAMWSAAIAGITLFASALFMHRAAIGEAMLRRQLAALSALEVNAAREWRAAFGFHRELGKGSMGKDVIFLQKMLAARNYLAAKDVTGFYGARTRKAVAAFQAKESLSQTGEVDEVMRARLNDMYFNIVCPRPTAAYPDLAKWNVRKENPIPQEYSPDDLADVSGLPANRLMAQGVWQAGRGIWTSGVVCMRSEAAAALRRMGEAAARDGVRLGVTSGFRTADIQRQLYELWISLEGESARRAVAPPGASEHQLGTAVDLTGATVGYEGTPLRFDKSPEGRWLARHAAEYGFVLSFPEGRTGFTGYIYEPWHYRFMDRDAAAVMQSGVSIAEYLDAHPQSEYPRLRVASGAELSAAAAIAVYVPRQGAARILFGKDFQGEHPIASVTKLLTAIVAEHIFPPGTLIAVSPGGAREAVQEGQAMLEEGDAFSVEDMLTLLLVESSNRAARSLADAAGYEHFVGLMREKAAALGLASTTIMNVTGLDPRGGGALNASPPRALAELLRIVLDGHPALRTILGVPEARIQSTRGNSYRVRATNDLLSFPVWQAGIIGGKTGETPRAKQALLFAAESPNRSGYIIVALLESSDRFGDAKKMLEWLLASHEWESKP